MAVRRSGRMTGPSIVPGSAGSPTDTMDTKSTIFCTSVSCAARGTSTRVASAQPWPAWKYAGAATCGATVSRSSASSTMATDLPPSSRCTRFSVFAASSMMRFPVALEPVKLTLSMRGSVTSADAASPTAW